MFAKDLILPISLGPLLCKTKQDNETKVYIQLFTSNFTKAIHLQLVSNHCTQEFVMALKRLIARRVRASVIYSDKTKALAADSKQIGKIDKDEQIQQNLIKEQIK